MKDLFSGSLGRLNNHGGSRMFTTPNTISVPPEYEVETDVPSVAEFVTCSLDGRLWIWRRSRRYYIAVFRWDEETEKLVFVSTTVLNGETVIKRGVDWILTDKSLILSSDDGVYVSNVEDENEKINQSYFWFFETKTWEEIQNGQEIHFIDIPIDTSLTPIMKWDELPQDIKDIMVIYSYNDNDTQLFNDFIPQLWQYNNQLYAKCESHAGRFFVLPHIFGRDYEPIKFYLYISFDYVRDYENNDWDRLIIAPLNSNSACIFISENEGPCWKAKNAQVVSLPQGEQLDYSANNGAIFFDGLTGSTLMLNDNGASLLRDSLFYECKGLSQWIAPSGKVDAVSSQYVISSFDNGTLATYPQQGLHRELLTQNTILLTVKDYSEKRLVLRTSDKNNKKTIQVNNIKESLNFDITHLTISYKKCVDITPLEHYYRNNISDYITDVPEYESLIDMEFAFNNLLEWYLPNEINEWTDEGLGLLLRGIWLHNEIIAGRRWSAWFDVPKIPNLYFLSTIATIREDSNHKAYFYSYPESERVPNSFDPHFFGYTYFDKRSFNKGIYTSAIHFLINFNNDYPLSDATARSITVFKSKLYPEYLSLNFNML